MDIEISLRDVDSRCPYCHDGFDSAEEVVDCGVCQAKSHKPCVEELRACGACGSAGAGGTIKIVIPKWLQPPGSVREFCGRKHTKARRQGGVRRSGLCVACQEEWLTACGDEKFRDELVRKRNLTKTSLFRRIGSRWDEARPAPKASKRDNGASLAITAVLCLVGFFATFDVAYLVLFAAMGLGSFVLLHWNGKSG